MAYASFSAYCSVLFSFLLWTHIAAGYGPIGHQIIGAVADKKLADTAAGKKVAVLLDGLTLEKASVIADEIKGWDKVGADDPGIFHYSAHPKIDAQLRDFWRANQPTRDPNSPMPSHHWFHYTDVPVRDPEKYADGKVGRSKWDIVQMIRFCVRVLKGEEPENNARKITKPIAVILLAHYVGDIHQPLHVGAEYFDARGHAIKPEKEAGALEDEGGNTLILNLLEGTNPQPAKRPPKFHGFWDNDTVMANLPLLPETMPKEERRAKTDSAKGALIQDFATHEPGNWRLPSSIALKDYPETWADGILPIAREAHERLTFRNVAPLQEEDRVVAAGFADEKKSADGVSYYDWSARVVREQLHKAGWRLADLLEQALR
jgi:S1/P1 nuclease